MLPQNDNHKLTLVYGNTAEVLDRPVNRCTHAWKLYVRPLTVENIPVKKVRFELDASYNNPVRVLTRPPFEVREIGYAEFTAVIKVFLHQGVKVVVLQHKISFCDSDKNGELNRVFVKEFRKEIDLPDFTNSFHQSLITGASRKTSFQSLVVNRNTQHKFQMSNADQKKSKEIDNTINSMNLGNKLLLY